MCVDFMSLNKACSQDPFPLPRIDQIVNATVECDLLCFLDAISGYHQIKIARLMDIALGRQLGRNAEAYIDDIVVKSREERTLVEDLKETFANMRKRDRGNPEKIKAIERMSLPQTLKEMQKLAGRMTSLGRFISKLGERTLPFFKLMKKEGAVRMDSGGRGCLSGHQEVPYQPSGDGGTSTSRAPGALPGRHTPLGQPALVAVREECVGVGAQRSAPSAATPSPPQDSVLEVTTTSSDDKAPETPVSLEGPGAVNNSSLVEHPVYFVALAYHLERVLQSPNAVGRVAECNIELQAFQLEFSSTRVIKGAALTVFVAEWIDAPDRGVGEDRSLMPGDEAPDVWVMYFDVAFARHGAGVGAVLIAPTQDKLYYTVQLCFQHGEKVSKNITEYEGLIAGLRAAMALGHVSRDMNKEADDIAKRASRREPQRPGVFE
ncbi:uncharacterized protein [Aegilops tauschii subsp. strangulata]|uniref:uncharacterized protein n=1 Tax=Aegilops tauschii subsp. strangulata TaxID=200361 RepID=UPI003CC867F9